MNVVFIAEIIILACRGVYWRSKQLSPATVPMIESITLGIHSIYPLLKVTRNTEIEIITSHLDKTETSKSFIDTLVHNKCYLFLKEFKCWK